MESKVSAISFTFFFSMISLAIFFTSDLLTFFAIFFLLAISFSIIFSICSRCASVTDCAVSSSSIPSESSFHNGSSSISDAFFTRSSARSSISVASFGFSALKFSMFFFAIVSAWKTAPSAV